MRHPGIVTVVLLAVSTTIRAAEPPVTPERLRRALEKPAPALTTAARHAGTSLVPRTPATSVAEPSRVRRQTVQPSPRPDSIWEGLLIGAAAGGVGGYIWARQICGGTDDTECFIISAPVGIAGGVGIGALVGAVVDKLHK